MVGEEIGVSSRRDQYEEACWEGLQGCAIGELQLHEAAQLSESFGEWYEDGSGHFRVNGGCGDRWCEQQVGGKA